MKNIIITYLRRSQYEIEIERPWLLVEAGLARPDERFSSHCTNLVKCPWAILTSKKCRWLFSGLFFGIKSVPNALPHDKIIIYIQKYNQMQQTQAPFCSFRILSSAALALRSLSNFVLISGVKPLASSSLFSCAVFCTCPRASALPLPAAFPRGPISSTFGPSRFKRSVSVCLRSSSFCKVSWRSRESRCSASDLFKAD